MTLPERSGLARRGRLLLMAKSFASQISGTGLAMSLGDELIDALTDAEVPEFFEILRTRHHLTQRPDKCWEEKHRS